MKIEYAVRVDIGIKETNDDMALAGGCIHDSGLESGSCETPCVAVLCDGCGGYAGGAIAARTVLETIRDAEEKSLGETSYLEETLQKCKDAVYAKKAESARFQNMCTTVAGVYFGEDETIIFHAGDSRVYRFDGSILAKMTVDHSAVQMMVNMGKMTEEEALVAPNRNVINRCIGIDCLPPEIDVSHSPILPGEMFMLCSDGLWEYVRKEKIKEFLSSKLPLKDIAGQLVQCALDNGSSDNVSVCICYRPKEGSDEISKEDEDALD